MVRSGIAVLLRADLAKISSGRPTSLIRSRISRRPLAHVVNSVNAIAPTSSGNQPPSGTLVKFAAKYAPSTRKKIATAGTANHHFQRQTIVTRTASRQVSISIAPVTAMP